MPPDNTAYRPLPGGAQIEVTVSSGGSVASHTSGTLGIVLKDVISNDRFLVTNAHVLFNSPRIENGKKKGLALGSGVICQPVGGQQIAQWTTNDILLAAEGKTAGSKLRTPYLLKSLIGPTVEAKTFIDIAAVRLDPGPGVSIDDNYIGHVLGANKVLKQMPSNHVKVGSQVMIRGAKSGVVISGKVVTTSYYLKGQENNPLTRQILIECSSLAYGSSDDKFSDSGDSGSAVFTTCKQRYLVGFLVGAPTDQSGYSGTSAIIPAEIALKYLRLTPLSV